MAFVELHNQSNVLGMAMTVWAVIPQDDSGMGKKRAAVKKWPVLYLLHGLSDDHSIWLRKTSIERYALEAGLAVIMPCVHRSFYADMVQGYKYWTYVSKELPYHVNQFFPVSEKREDTFVAGLSMGGYGAFKLALNCPDRFAAAASLSGALTLDGRRDANNSISADLDLCFGPPARLRNSENDLLYLLRKMGKRTGGRPRLYQWCGTEDFLYGSNTAFRDYAAKQGVKVEYSEGPGGHTWDCWDAQIQKVIRWLPL